MASKMRLIDANEAQERFHETYCKNCNNYNGIKCRACELKDGADIYDDMPEVDAVPVKHGYWMKYEVDVAEHPWHCSRCGGCPPNFVWHVEEMKYCNHCGACMDGKDGESNV